MTFYLIPPILSLLVSLILAGIAIRTKPRTTELKLFSIICLWWGLLSPVFISHHFLTSISQILAFERFIHFFYVFLPALNIAIRASAPRHPPEIGCLVRFSPEWPAGVPQHPRIFISTGFTDMIGDILQKGGRLFNSLAFMAL